MEIGREVGLENWRWIRGEIGGKEGLDLEEGGWESGYWMWRWWVEGGIEIVDFYILLELLSVSWICIMDFWIEGDMEKGGDVRRLQRMILYKIFESDFCIFLIANT